MPQFQRRNVPKTKKVQTRPKAPTSSQPRPLMSINLRRRRPPRRPILRRLAARNPQLAAKTTATGMRKPGRVRGPRLTSAGVSFLKCAFAPPDFTSTGVTGIPDNFRGLTLLKKHRYNTTFNCAASNDYYIILPPVPGVAYYSTYVGAGGAIPSTTVFTPTYYTDYHHFSVPILLLKLIK